MPVRTSSARAIAIGGGFAFAASAAYVADGYARRWASLRPTRDDVIAPVAIDLLLFFVFALHHSVFARAGLKARLQRWIPPALERSCYVWIASLLFFLMGALWQAVPGTLWNPGGWPAAGLLAVQVAAAGFVVISARHLDVLGLAGIQQAVGDAARPASALYDRGPYGVVRHPMHLGLLAMLWAAPAMTGTHAVFAVASTVYVFIAIPFEERELRRALGSAYDEYARRVTKRLVPGIY